MLPDAAPARFADLRIAERRARAPRPPAGRERTVNLVNGALVLLGVVAIAAFVPGSASPLVTVAFIAAYACAARVEFEISAGAAVPTQLVFVPALLVLPPAIVPLVVACGLVLSNAPAYIAGDIHPERAISVITSAAYSVAPSLILVAYGSQPLGWEHWPLYVVLFAAQTVADCVHTVVREAIALGVGPRELLRPLGWVYGIDALLTPAGLLLAFAVAPQPLSILAALPLVLLLALFGRERRTRLDHALELEGALRVNQQLDELVNADPLTGVPNRRAWEDGFPTMLENARAAGQPLCVAMLDLDHFKRYNDAHGHPAGDDLLRRVTAAWSGQLRPGDLLARLGGEEFGLVLPGCGAADAIRLADRLRRVVPDGQSCSIGIAGAVDGETGAFLVARADQALYDAKAGGRNRVVLAASSRPVPVLTRAGRG